MGPGLGAKQKGLEMTAKVEQRELVRKGRVFDVTVERVTLPNGSCVDMDIVRHPGAAAIVAVDEENQVLMLQQYRHAAGGTLWEIPAGTLEKHEDPADCARRELVEETGCSAEHWTYLGMIVPVPGYSDEKIHIYLARDLKKARQNLDPDEIIQVERLPLNRLMSMIAGGEINDAKTMAGLMLALPKLGHPLL